MARAMKDSGIEWIGEIPEGWSTGKVKNYYSIKGESGYPDEQVLSLYRELGIVIKSERDDNFNKTSENTDNYKFVEEEDLVVNKMKAWQGSIATSKYQGIVSPAYYVFKLVDNCIEPFYIHYLLRSSVYLPEYRRLSGGIRPGQWDLSVDNFKNIMVLLPPKDEQERVVDYLNSKCKIIDNTIQNQKIVIEKLKLYKQSVITEAVTKGLNPNAKMRPSGIEWIGDIPRHWKLLTLGNIIEFEGGSQPPLEYFIDEEREGYIRLIQIRDYKTNDYATYIPISMAKKFCDVNDVMIGRYGPPLFQVLRGLRGAYNVALMKAVPIGINKEWMYFYLLQNSLLDFIESLSKRTAGQSGVNPNKIKKYPAPVPPIQEQQEIAIYLKRKCPQIDSIIIGKQKLIEKLTEYKKSLIYECVTGKREVI